MSDLDDKCERLKRARQGEHIRVRADAPAFTFTVSEVIELYERCRKAEAAEYTISQMADKLMLELARWPEAVAKVREKWVKNLIVIGALDELTRLATEKRE